MQDYLEAHLQANIDGTLCRIGESATSASLRVPKLKLREGVQIHARQVNSHAVVGIPQLHIFEFEERRISEPVGRVSGIIGHIHLGQPRILGIDVLICRTPTIVGNKLQDISVILRSKGMESSKHHRTLSHTLEKDTKVHLFVDNIRAKTVDYLWDSRIAQRYLVILINGATVLAVDIGLILILDITAGDVG